MGKMARMEMRKGVLKFATVALGAAAMAMVGFGGVRATASDNLLRVHFVGCPNAKGSVKCAIYNSPDGFPTDRSKILEGAEGPVVGNAAVCSFKDLPAGTYAVAAFQDEDGSGNIRKNMLGIPTEVYGFSNDAKPTFKAPSFQAASFQYSGGAQDVTIHAQ